LEGGVAPKRRVLRLTMYDGINGIDISHHQGTVDFDAVQASGQRFVVVKATEGATYRDPKFESYWRELVQRQDKMVRGAYHFARPDNQVGKDGGYREADNFCRALESVGGYTTGCFCLALDFETYSPSTRVENEPFIRGFAERVTERLGRKVTIYTGANIWNYEVGNTLEFSDLRLWLASYTRSPDFRNPPLMPKGIGGWPVKIWQWSGGGDFAYATPIPGVGVVDRNAWLGTLEELHDAAWMLRPEPAPELTPGVMPTGSYEAIAGDKSTVRRLQGLLLAKGLGPEGLVGPDGKPDGELGPKTRMYLDLVACSTGEVTGDLWHELLRS